MDRPESRAVTVYGRRRGLWSRSPAPRLAAGGHDPDRLHGIDRSPEMPAIAHGNLADHGVTVE
ncbi:hypothetical protein BRD17_10235 [Halobacteriales archaeon SW_7_68_16]|nr:MAG: hypothetical protein BRD17_10235 [Halobacteriales archaeon SW_7_68_16]